MSALCGFLGSSRLRCLVDGVFVRSQIPEKVKLLEKRYFFMAHVRSADWETESKIVLLLCRR